MQQNYFNLKTKLLSAMLFTILLLNGQNTPHSVSMDPSESNMSAFGSNGTIANSVTTFYTHWDTNYLYVGWSEGRTNYSSDMYYVAIDTDPNSTTGSSNTIEGVGFSSTKALPDYYAVYENNTNYYGLPTSNGNAIEFYNGTSGSWNFVSRNGGDDGISSQIDFQDSPNGEVRMRIAWADMEFTPGNNKPIGISYWTNNSSGDYMWSRYPNSNPSTGSTNILLTHQIIFNSTGSGINPSTSFYENSYSDNTTYSTIANGSWNTSSNWEYNGIPTSGGDISVNHSMTQDVDATIDNMFVNSSSNLTINSGITLTINDQLTLQSISDSYPSLISNGTITGTVNYERYVNAAAESGTTTGGNDLISAPLTGQTFGDFKTANPNILSGNIGGVGPYYLFGPFDTANNQYNLYYDTDDDASTLNAGKGYRTGSDGGGTYTFTGDVETTDISINIYNGTQSNWNLIGNPYPSYISLSDFLTQNASQFDSYSSGVYGYNGEDSNSWVIWNNAYALAHPGTVIAPGQGFFVSSINEEGTVTFDADSRTTGSSDDFIANRNPEVVTNMTLSLSNTSSSFTTDIYFTEFTSLGLDSGYDSSLFGGNAPAFAVYTHLVADNTGVPLAIQSLGETDYNNVTIPVGVNAAQGEQLTFSMTTNTLPSNIDIYLEDILENSSTLLNSSDYILTPSTDLNGTGRFYLNFSNSTLSTLNNKEDKINIYTNNQNKTIIISGVLEGFAITNIYDLQGRIVKTSQLINSKVSQTVDVSMLSNGVYIVELNSGSLTKTQKVILR